ncbi:MAG TPA: sortase [Chloroflexota bacterium]|nr:sortase [Chloroflexota bacterium]
MVIAPWPRPVNAAAGADSPAADAGAAAAPSPAGDATLPDRTAALPPTDRLLIPGVGIDTPVVEVGVNAAGEMDVVDNAAGRSRLGAEAGETGNVLIGGHLDTRGAVFRLLPQVQEGDDVFLFRRDAVFHYRVEQRIVVREEGVSLEQRRANARWIQPTTDPVLTLITCYPYGLNTHRLLVRARLIPQRQD